MTQKCRNQALRVLEAEEVVVKDICNLLREGKDWNSIVPVDYTRVSRIPGWYSGLGCDYLSSPTSWCVSFGKVWLLDRRIRDAMYLGGLSYYRLSPHYISREQRGGWSEYSEQSELTILENIRRVPFRPLEDTLILVLDRLEEIDRAVRRGNLTDPEQREALSLIRRTQSEIVSYHEIQNQWNLGLRVSREGGVRSRDRIRPVVVPGEGIRLPQR